MMWPFRKRKDEPALPPINEDWQVGDQAECIISGGNDWQPAGCGPEKGDVCQVLEVKPGKFRNNRLGWALRFSHWKGNAFDAADFRKVPPRNATCDAEFAARIKSLKPKRVGA